MVKINWSRGINLGIYLFYFGVMGLTQSLLIIPVAQYILQVGSLYVLVLVPIGITLAMTYGGQMMHEIYSQVRIKKQSKNRPKPGEDGVSKTIYEPLLIVIGSFLAIFWIVYAICIENMASINAFVIAENIAAIGVLVIATILENQYMPSKRN
jgi:hypothetical protein